MSDDRQYAPATLRNRDFILDVLRNVLPMTGVILEIASGSGEHIVHFASSFPAFVFQPSDPKPDARQSVAAWVKATRATSYARANRWILGSGYHRNARKQSERGVPPDVIEPSSSPPATLA
jgi:hypothetical protein